MKVDDESHDLPAEQVVNEDGSCTFKVYEGDGECMVVTLPLEALVIWDRGLRALRARQNSWR